MGYCSSNVTAVAYGVAFAFEATPGTCYCKNRGVLSTDSVSNDMVHTALTVNVNLAPNSQCPYANASTQDAADGGQYEILCDEDMVLVDDLCPSTSPTYSGNTGDLGTTCPTHANDLMDCMDQCSAAHPLCVAVSFNPAMSYGYGNCYFKSNVSAASIETWNSPNDTRHMAVLNQNAWGLNLSCTNGSTYVSPNQAEFKVVCSQNIYGDDLVQLHMQNLSACADACATYSNKSGLACVGAVFDSTLLTGYQNCWLKSGSEDFASQGGLHWAELSKAATSTSLATKAPPSPSSSPLVSSPSLAKTVKGLSAGLAVFVVLGLAASVLAFIFWRRLRRLQRRPEQSRTAQSIQTPPTSPPAAPPPTYPEHAPPQGLPRNEDLYHFRPYQPRLAQPEAAIPGARTQEMMPSIDSSKEMQELGGTNIVEMPASNNHEKSQDMQVFTEVSPL